MKLSDDEVLAIVGEELSQAELYVNWREPLDRYLGNPDGKEVEGRSAVVSTDIADAIEWMMPQIMKAFVQNNEVIIFDPVDETDETQAEIESAYVYDVILKENPGYIILYTFIKDALLHNNGIIKVFYEETDASTVQSFTGITDQELTVVAMNESVDILQYSRDLDGTNSVKIKIKGLNKSIVLESVPPENFLYNRGHNSVDVSNARFTAQILNKTASDLKEMGVDDDTIEEVSGRIGEDRNYFRFGSQNESVDYLGTRTDKALSEVTVAECYTKMDYNGDGIAELMKVTVIGERSPTHIISIEAIDSAPWITTTGILMSHKFRGLSIYDRLIQIQQQKTALLRNTLDNIYLQNNQRTAVVEGQVNIDDLLTSRPGGIVRVKNINGILPIATPQVGANTFQMMTYLDQVRAGRVGVAPEGEAAPGNIGYRIGSEGVDRIFNAKEELVGLIIRTIAETGIKPLCIKIRELLNKHIDAVKPFKYRGQWVRVAPMEWTQKRLATARVGTGTGNHERQIDALMGVLQAQKEILANPGQSLVTQSHVYAALNDLAKFQQLNGASKYFVDPASPLGQQLAQQKNQEQQILQRQNQQIQVTQLQAEAQIAMAQMKLAEAEQENVRLKAITETLKHKLDVAVADTTAAHKDADRELKKYEIDNKASIELAKIKATTDKNEIDAVIKAQQMLAHTEVE